jgi:hypothetical protein
MTDRADDRAEDTDPSETTPDVPRDEKDWTWVLARACPECGFEAQALAVADVGPLVRDAAVRWQRRLEDDDARVRPAAGVWSPTEYAAHVRDVFRVFDVRLAAMLESDDPQFANWDQDAAALEDGYAHQDPAVVGAELAAAAQVVATRFDAVSEDQHERPGSRSNGSVFTVTTLGQYFAHDVVHHLHDVGA